MVYSEVLSCVRKLLFGTEALLSQETINKASFIGRVLLKVYLYLMERAGIACESFGGYTAKSCKFCLECPRFFPKDGQQWSYDR